jgi:hypothetical protein
MSKGMLAATAVRHSLPVLIATFISLPAVAQDVTFDPERVRLEVQDLRRLAQVMRSIEAGDVQDTPAMIEREYLAMASPGLRAYARRFEVTAGTLMSALRARPALYADLDALADTILAQEPVLRAGFRRLQEIFPRAAFPPVWFFAGSHGPRGLADVAGALIGSEGLTSRPEDIAPLVLHELAHFQSAMVQGVDVYQRIYGPSGTLLALALREGSAELIAELTTGRHTNPAAERYGKANEAELWTRFREDMGGRAPGDWMFVRPANQEWPANLGYWIGYRIVRSYYDQAEDKSRAIAEILNLTDFEGFLDASGYGDRMGGGASGVSRDPA